MGHDEYFKVWPSSDPDREKCNGEVITLQLKLYVVLDYFIFWPAIKFKFKILSAKDGAFKIRPLSTIVFEI